MKEIYKARCTKGFLVVYPDKVAIELKVMGIHKVNSIAIQSVTGVDVKTGLNGFFGLGASRTVIIYRSGDQKLVAEWIQMKHAKKIQEIILNLIAEKTQKEPSEAGLNDLEKLAELKDKGIISNEEFELKKKQILGI